MSWIKNSSANIFSGVVNVAFSVGVSKLVIMFMDIEGGKKFLYFFQVYQMILSIIMAAQNTTSKFYLKDPHGFKKNSFGIFVLAFLLVVFCSIAIHVYHIVIDSSLYDSKMFFMTMSVGIAIPIIVLQGIANANKNNIDAFFLVLGLRGGVFLGLFLAFYFHINAYAAFFGATIIFVFFNVKRILKITSFVPDFSAARYFFTLVLLNLSYIFLSFGSNFIVERLFFDDLFFWGLSLILSNAYIGIFTAIMQPAFAIFLKGTGNSNKIVIKMIGFVFISSLFAVSLWLFFGEWISGIWLAQMNDGRFFYFGLCAIVLQAIRALSLPVSFFLMAKSTSKNIVLPSVVELLFFVGSILIVGDSFGLEGLFFCLLVAVSCGTACSFLLFFKAGKQ